MKFIVSLISLVIFSLPYVSSKSALVQLNEENWHLMLEGEWMVEFFASWCPACKALQPIWNDFATWGDDLGISVAQVDVTDSPGLSGRFMVTALPTIFHVKDGVFRLYRGPRDKEQFLSFVEERKWKEAEEIPAWKSPGSYQMAVVSQFFKLSMVLRSVHSTLVKDYGLPEWCSYLVFAVCTIVVGALIGLLLVCIIDFLFPPKPMRTTCDMAKQIADKEEDLIEDRPDEEGDPEEEQEDEEQEEEEEGEGGDAGDAGDGHVSSDQQDGESQPEDDLPEVGGDSGGSSEVRKRKFRRAD